MWRTLAGNPEESGKRKKILMVGSFAYKHSCINDRLVAAPFVRKCIQEEVVAMLFAIILLSVLRS